MKRGQVWVESVLYTLIGLSLIALVLIFITPRITETKDRLAIEQTIESLQVLDDKINIRPGNVRNVDFTMKRGELYILSAEDKIVFIFDDIEKPYSEPGVEIEQGKIKILTEKEQKDHRVTLTMEYSGVVDLQYDETEEDAKFTAAPTPYKLSITSKSSGDGYDIISIKELS